MLNSLQIANFRLLEHFTVPKLGRVNLIVGKNNSGKSSVLEALRIYAGSAQRKLLQQIALAHNEQGLVANPGEATDQARPFEAFFTGRNFGREQPKTITIGPDIANHETLSIAHGSLVSEQLEIDTDEGKLSQTRIRFTHNSDGYDGTATPCLRVSKGKNILYDIRLDSADAPLKPSVWAHREALLPCSYIPTQFVSLGELADEWDKIALTSAQNVVTDALQIIAPDFEALTFVRDVGAQGLQRTAMVKLSTFAQPVPLRSLGDGFVRILQLVLKLLPARGGFLLIDEFENGLHFSVQEKIWDLLLTMAERLDIQIFATTHSWDCIESFARAAHANKAAEGLLFRVGHSVLTSDQGRIIATVFDEEQLYSITQADVEVR